MNKPKVQMRPKAPKPEKKSFWSWPEIDWPTARNKTKRFIMRTVGLVGLTALAIDDVHLRADDQLYMGVVGIGFALALVYLAYEGSRR